MNHCVLCDGWYTGRTRDDLCPTCELRDRQYIFSDPRDTAQFARRQLQRMGLDVMDVVPDRTCARCGRRIDDHTLTYTAKPYETPLCLVEVGPLPEGLRQPPEEPLQPAH